MHLPMEAAFAVRGGLSEDAAVRAITIDAARVLGIDHRVGSIEVGKDADFAIVDGQLLYYMTLVRWTVVNGRVAYDKQKETLLDHIRPGGDRNAPPPEDYWPRSLGEVE
jgi:imidazolonepropionase-like amidohydrolase